MSVTHGSIETLQLAPLTGGRMVEPEHAVLTVDGLEHAQAKDRSWVLYDPQHGNTRISAAQNPLIRRIATDTYVGHTILLFHNAMNEVEDSMTIPSSDETAPLVVDEFENKTPAFDLGDEVAERFSRFIGKSVRLAEKDWDDFAIDPSQRKNAPLHIVSMGTLVFHASKQGVTVDELVKKLRPNLVVQSELNSGPDVEQEWKKLIIGDSEIAVHRPTKRCKVPSQHPLTGADLNDFPLRDLPKFTDPTTGREVRTVGVYAYPLMRRRNHVSIMQVGDTVRIES